LVLAEGPWCFKSLDDCHTVASDESMRIVIVVAGTFRRLFLTIAVRHLLRPLVQQGYTVDSCFNLTTDAAKAYRTGYMNETTWDTAAFGSELAAFVASSMCKRRLIFTSLSKRLDYSHTFAIGISQF
jgi:hypothetical protein